MSCFVNLSSGVIFYIILFLFVRAIYRFCVWSFLKLKFEFNVRVRSKTRGHYFCGDVTLCLKNKTMQVVTGYFDYCVSETCFKSPNFKITAKYLLECKYFVLVYRVNLLSHLAVGYKTIAVNQTLEEGNLKTKKKKKKGESKDVTDIVPEPLAVHILKEVRILTTVDVFVIMLNLLRMLLTMDFLTIILIFLICFFIFNYNRYIFWWRSCFVLFLGIHICFCYRIVRNWKFWTGWQYRFLIKTSFIKS